MIREEVEYQGEEVKIGQASRPVGNQYNFTQNKKLSAQRPDFEAQQKNIKDLQILEEGGLLSSIPEPKTERRESKSSQILKLLENDKQRKDVNVLKPTLHHEYTAIEKPPSGKRGSLGQFETDSTKHRAHSDSGKNRSMPKETKGSQYLSVKSSKINESSLNSSLNEIEYHKNFNDLVERVDKIIQERRKLKIVPYSKKERKKLLVKAEKYMVLMTKMMKHRKEDFKSIIDDELFK